MLIASLSWVNLTYEGTVAPMKAKKHLSFTALRKFLSSKFRTWSDKRRQESTQYSLHDALMSGFACMYFQEPSLLQFQQEMEEKSQQNNLRILFAVQDLPKTNALKEIIDDQDSRRFNPIFKGIAQRLQRGKQLDQFKLYDGLTVCSMDGTGYHSSESLHCKQCLTKNKDNPDKPTIYQHFALQAAFMHRTIRRQLSWPAHCLTKNDTSWKLLPHLESHYHRSSRGVIVKWTEKWQSGAGAI